MPVLTAGRTVVFAVAFLAGACSGAPGKSGVDPERPWLVDPRNASSADTLIEAAHAAYEAGQYLPAADFYQRARHLRRMEKRQDDEPLMGLGRAMMAVGGYTEAAEAFGEVVKIKSRYQEARIGLGFALLALGQPLVAKEHFTVAMDLGPTVQTYNGMGVAHDMVKDHQSAQKMYRAGLELEPGDTHLRNNLSISLALSGDTEGAIGQLGHQAESPNASMRERMALALTHALAGNARGAGAVVPFDIDYHRARLQTDQQRRLRTLRSVWREDGVVREIPEGRQAVAASAKTDPPGSKDALIAAAGAEVAEADGKGAADDPAAAEAANKNEANDADSPVSPGEPGESAMPSAPMALPAPVPVAPPVSLAAGGAPDAAAPAVPEPAESPAPVASESQPPAAAEPEVIPEAAGNDLVGAPPSLPTELPPAPVIGSAPVPVPPPPAAVTIPPATAGGQELAPYSGASPPAMGPVGEPDILAGQVPGGGAVLAPYQTASPAIVSPPSGAPYTSGSGTAEGPVLAPYGETPLPPPGLFPQGGGVILSPYQSGDSSAAPVPLAPYRPPGKTVQTPTAVPSGARPDPAKGGFQVQIGSFREQGRAERRWSVLRRTVPDLFSGVVPSVEQARVGTGRTLYYRLRTGRFPARASASSFCGKLKARSIPCIVVTVRPGSGT